jgi:hypothetical protein
VQACAADGYTATESNVNLTLRIEGEKMLHEALEPRPKGDVALAASWKVPS